jgi:hypothetical protein
MALPYFRSRASMGDALDHMRVVPPLGTMNRPYSLLAE